MIKKTSLHLFKSGAVALLFCAASLPATVGSPAHADPSEQAEALLKAMSDYDQNSANIQEKAFHLGNVGYRKITGD